MDAQKLFLTVHGTAGNDETITFRVYDKTTGETLPVSETIVFQGQCLGQVDNPMLLYAKPVTTGIDGLSNLSGISAIHSTSVVRISRMRKGVNIVTKADGTTHKVVNQ